MRRMERTIRKIRRKMTRKMKMGRMRMRMNRVRGNAKSTARTRRRMRMVRKHMISLAGLLAKRGPSWI